MRVFFLHLIVINYTPIIRVLVIETQSLVNNKMINEWNKYTDRMDDQSMNNFMPERQN